MNRRTIRLTEEQLNLLFEAIAHRAVDAGLKGMLSRERSFNQLSENIWLQTHPEDCAFTLTDAAHAFLAEVGVAP